MEDFVCFALNRGFVSYGFSSHAPLPFPTAWTMEWDCMDDYLAEFRHLREKYAGRIELYVGLEIDYLDEVSNPAAACFQNLPLDYRIGSIHLLHDESGHVVDADLAADKFQRMVECHFHGDVEQVVRQYYARSLRMVELGGFDIVGHADKVHYNAEYCQPGITATPWYNRLVRDYFAEIARRGYFMEINTKAYADLGTFYPDECHFGLLRRLGIPVMVNSDAHYPDRVDSGMADACRALRRAGFTSLMRLKEGKWTPSSDF